MAWVRPKPDETFPGGADVYCPLVVLSPSRPKARACILKRGLRGEMHGPTCRSELR